MGGGPSRGNVSGNTRKNIANIENTNCTDLKFNTQLASPKISIISTLKSKDILDLFIWENGCRAYFGKEYAGSIICLELNKLLKCMKNGNVFVGIVRNVNGAKCSITVQHIDTI